MSKAEFKQPFHPEDQKEEEEGIIEKLEKEDDERPCIVVSGSPGDGFSFIGPFEDGAAAVEWAEIHLKDEAWWVSGLETPEKDSLEDE